MNLSIDRFGEFFGALYHDKQGQPVAPFPWQMRLAKQVFDDGWPACIDLPTASGKTAAIEIAVFVLACQSERATNERTVGRRIFFAVNRRVIVDEAFDRADHLAKALIEAEDHEAPGILGAAARALRSLNEESDPSKAPPLDRAQLRGGIYQDRAWARSITQPIVVCTTADQLGSRLLFRGYGVSASSAPIHAALCGCDSLVLLDEAHVTRAFSQTMQLLTRYQAQHSTAPKMQFVQMTATPTDDVKGRFQLDRGDRAHPILKARQKASKPATLVKLDKKKPIADAIVARAFEALSDSHKAVGIIVNRVHTAREIDRLIREEIDRRTREDDRFSANVHLVVGRMRPVDRDDLQEELRRLVGPDRPDDLDTPVFVVATQCLEVGADYDFDVLITECASIDALRQRMGRLNRKGRSIKATAAVIVNAASLKDEDPIYGGAITQTWEWLWSNKDEHDQVDFGIAEFDKLWGDVDDDARNKMLAPAPDAAVLLPAHLDALCQTSSLPVPSPDVSYFVHGPQRDMAEVNICWRADLGNDPLMWPDIVRLLPPTSIECMTVPLWEVQRLMGQRFKAAADADVPTQNAEAEDDRDRNGELKMIRMVAWRYGYGPDDDTPKRLRLVGVLIDNPRQLKPGDTVVMPALSRSWHELGHIPIATKSNYERGGRESDDEHLARCASLDRSVDVAERAVRQSRLRLAIRLHDAFPGRSELRGLSADELLPLLTAMLEKEITADNEPARVLAVLHPRFERHRYDMVDDGNPETKHNELIIFKDRIEAQNRLELPASNEDDGQDDLSEGIAWIPLECHTQHVVDRLALSLEKLHVTELDSAVRASAPLHDIGKADLRFQAMLAGVTPCEAMMLPKLLGKGSGVRSTRAEWNAICERALYPRGFRHEMLSVELIEHLRLELGLAHRDLLLHLIAAHHGYARPFAPVIIDDAADEVCSIKIGGTTVTAAQRRSWSPSHRLDSGIPTRFWKLTREHGWWGLAWLESILRLADQQASAAEQDEQPSKEGLFAFSFAARASAPQSRTGVGNSVVLKSLDGSNPLAFLAALGTLRTLTLGLPDESVKMSWEQYQGAWRPRVWCSLAGDSDMLIDGLTQNLIPKLPLPWIADKRLPFAASLLRKLMKDVAGDFSMDKYAAAGLLSAFGSEVFVDEKGNFADTSFRMVRSGDSAGQGLLHYACKNAQSATAEDIRTSLFARWVYSDRGSSFRWDPAEDRMYALQANNPSDDGSLSVLGANRLALESLVLFPVQPTHAGAATTGFVRPSAHADLEFHWPIWTVPLTPSVTASLIAGSTLLGNVAADIRRAMGIVVMFKSRQFKPNQYYRNFSPAEPM